jgi:hypothetical protein
VATAVTAIVMSSADRQLDMSPLLFRIHGINKTLLAF